MPQNKIKNKERIMDSAIKYVNGFFGGLLSIMMAVLPVTILWTVLTGGTVFGMDVIANLTALVNSLGNGGFVGLIVLVVVMSFFIKK
tara:strand:+ start:6541 stop:6801 length:261 start_codon:yes stop_codon:yes gene_type:complete